MGSKKKIKKIDKAINVTREKILDLVKKGKDKKKIIKKIEGFSELYEKKVKRYKAKKEKSSTKPAEKPKTIAKTSSASIKPKVAPKKSPAPVRTQRTVAAKVANKKTTNRTKTTTKVSSTAKSTDFNAKEAASKLISLKTVSSVEKYIVGEKRATVLSRAKSRINALSK